MQVRVLLFAAARERVGKSEIFVELHEPTSAGELRERVITAHPALAPLQRVLRVAVNEALVADDARIEAHDEIALLPPVSGGQGSHAAVMSEALSLDRVVGLVTDHEHGAIATFSGVVRRTSHGLRVERLDYEAYVPMAERVMREIVGEIRERRPSVRVAMEHRIGALAVGELAVVIAAGAPHRRDALLACDEAIEAVKARAPIWKREHTEGGATWVGCEGCAPAIARE